MNGFPAEVVYSRMFQILSLVPENMAEVYILEKLKLKIIPLILYMYVTIT